MKNDVNVKCVLDAKATLGECPVWEPGESALYWVDILAPALHRFEPATGATRTWRMLAAIGSFGLCGDGRAVVALRSGVQMFDFRTERLTPMCHPEAGMPDLRYNDGKVSPEGRFWFGSMDDKEQSRPIGSLYRLDADGSCHKMLDGLVVSNGLAWSADGSTMYHSDSPQGVIRAFDYDVETGSLSNGRVFATPPAHYGLPDGGAVDREGFYWSAGVHGSVLNRWSPDGRLARQIPMPCEAPTAMCFGGPELRTLYVTSLTPESSDGGRRDGGVFAVDVDVPGVLVSNFVAAP